VTPESIKEWADPAPTDEGHHDVDFVSRVNLRSQLAPQRRLAGRVREQGRIEQWDQGHVESRRRAIWSTSQDAVQYRRRIHGSSARVGFDEFAKPIDEGTSHSKSDVDSMLVADIEKRTLDLPAHVPGDPIGCVRAVEQPFIDWQSQGEVVELRAQTLGDKHLV
jgi:hypothetical protein